MPPPEIENCYMAVISIIYSFRLWKALLKVICSYLKKVGCDISSFFLLYFTVLFLEMAKKEHATSQYNFLRCIKLVRMFIIVLMKPREKQWRLRKELRGSNIWGRKSVSFWSLSSSSPVKILCWLKTHCLWLLQKKREDIERLEKGCGVTRD